MPKFTLCVRMYVCKYVYLCICMYVCMYDVRHDIQIPCTRYVAINRLYLQYNRPVYKQWLCTILTVLFTIVRDVDICVIASRKRNQLIDNGNFRLSFNETFTEYFALCRCMTLVYVVLQSMFHNFSNKSLES